MDKIPRGDERHRVLLRSEEVQKLPSKLVFTGEPGDSPEAENRASWVKRKVRLVACGNLAAASSMDTYSGTAPAEVVRIALVLANKFGWIAGVVDIVSAFLRTPLDGDRALQIVVHPPKVLERALLVPAGELWKLTHALYGLREAPHLWGSYRDERLRPLTFECQGVTYKVVQGKIETSWWTIQEEQGDVIGVMVIYVDDILICADIHIVRSLAAAISGLWRTSDLALVTQRCPIRFLGLEIDIDEAGVFWVSQTGFIKELLRSKAVQPRRRDLVPITRELSALESIGDEQDDPDVTRDAQGATGEILWLSQRTRPDLSYTASIMATLSSKCPSRALLIAEKAIGYAQRTISYKLRLEATTRALTLCSDSSFAPDSSRSHTGWVILLYGAPVLWRSSRQATVSLSTAEAELNATLEGSVALLSIEALLKDVKVVFEEKEILTDSTSALTIASGSGSWRTRHLRIKSQWLQEQISQNQFKIGHCRGDKLVADLLTKALSSGRMQSLLVLWGMDVGMIEPPLLEAVPAALEAEAAAHPLEAEAAAHPLEAEAAAHPLEAEAAAHMLEADTSASALEAGAAAYTLEAEAAAQMLEADIPAPALEAELEAVDQSERQRSVIPNPSNPPYLIKALIALLALLHVRVTEGMELAPNYEELAPRGLAVDNTLLTSMWFMLMILCGVLGWEMLKWSVVTTTRRARRLMRLRDRTAEVVQREVRRQLAARETSESEPLEEPRVRTSPAAKSKARAASSRRTALESGNRTRLDAVSASSSALRPEPRDNQEAEREETVARGLFQRRRRQPPVEAYAQTDPWVPQVEVREVPVRVEVPVEVPSRESALLGDFEHLQETFFVTQFGEHYHCASQCDGLRKARTQVRPITPCLACLGNIQLFKRRRSFRRLTPSSTG